MKKSNKVPKTKKSFRDAISSFFFIMPAFVALILFVFIPLIFSFLMSLYNNPNAVNLRNPIEYYFDFANASMASLYRFFTNDSEYTKGVLLIEGLYLIFSALTLIFYVRLAYKILSKKIKKSKFLVAIIAIITGVIVSPLFMYIIKWFFETVTVVSLSISLPIDEYRDVLTSPEIDFVRVLFNTVFWTLTSTFFHLLLGIFLAVLLNRKFPGRGFFRGIFILPWAIPSFVSTLIWRAFVFDTDLGILGRNSSNFGTNNMYTFTLIDLILVLLSMLIAILFVVFSNWIIKTKTKVSQNVRKLLLWGLIIIACFIAYGLILLFNSFTNNMSSGILAYRIVDIPSITSTFWYTDDIFIFGTQFKMITFSAILVNTWLGVPFMMVSFSAALQSIPQDLYEAAEIDGASKWNQFKSITLPLLKPTFFTVSLLGIIWTFNLFNVVYLLTANQTGLGNAIYYDIFVTFIYGRFTEAEFSQAAALSFTIFLILISFSLIYRKMIETKQKEEKEMG